MMHGRQSGKIVATMTTEELRLYRLENRVRYLPTAIENTRRKLAALEDEARQLGMRDLASLAWEREIKLARESSK